MKITSLMMIVGLAYSIEVIEIPGNAGGKGGLVVLGIKDSEPVLVAPLTIPDLKKEFQAIYTKGLISNIVIFRLVGGLTGKQARIMEEIDKENPVYPCLETTDIKVRSEFNEAVVLIYCNKRK